MYIDVIHHPIRYLDDLMHAFSTNDKGVYYKLMKYQENPDLFKLKAISSGTLYEAKYFGNKIKYFYKQPFLYGEDFINQSEEDFDFKEVFVSVNKFYLQFDFWSDVLSPLIKTKSKSPVQHLSLDNTLRYALGVSWGYNDCHYLSIEQKVPLAILLKKQNKGYLSIWKFYKKVFGNKKVFPFYYIYNHIDRKLKRKGII